MPRLKNNNNRAKKKKVKETPSPTTELPSCVTCPVCRDLYLNPTIYKCGHTLCRSCISSMPQDFQMKCPFCRAHSDELTPNYIVSEIIETVFKKELELRISENNKVSRIRKKLDIWEDSVRHMYIKSFIENKINNKPKYSVQTLISRLKDRGFKKSETRYLLAKMFSSRKFKSNHIHCEDLILNLEFCKKKRFPKWILRKPGCQKRMQIALMVKILQKNYKCDIVGFKDFAQKNNFNLGLLDKKIFRSTQELPYWVDEIVNINELPDKLSEFEIENFNTVLK